PGDRKSQVSSDADGPFDEGGCKLTDLDAGNVSGADTDAGIIIAGGSFQYRPVGVARDQDTLACPRPARQRFFDPFLFPVFSGRVRRIQKTDPFQRTPEASYQETGLPPQHTIQKVGLVPVSQIEIRSGLLIPKYQPGVKPDIRKQGFLPAGDAGVESITLTGKCGRAFAHVMIAVHEVQTLIFMYGNQDRKSTRLNSSHV